MARSADVTPTVAGTYRWRAVYSGDANNEAASTSCSEPTQSSSVATAPGGDPVAPVTSSHTATIIQPGLAPPTLAVAVAAPDPGVVLTAPPGTARLVRTTARCVARPFRVDVVGTRIAKVTFRIDGRKVRALARPDARGRWSLRIDPRRRSRKRHALTVLVGYTAGSATPDPRR